MKRLAFLVLLALGASGAAAQEPRNVRFQGAPRIGSEQGWSLKPRGRLQYDFGHIETIGSVDELRRARIGVEGTAPGGFDYVFEIDVAPDVIEIA
ncbi:MAG TPA: hypothetical protein VJS15_10405, partial [Allosphingosinicella sp.]|nr:hypothetical protein [Allosphingosinicella sp.]